MCESFFLNTKAAVSANEVANSAQVLFFDK